MITVRDTDHKKETSERSHQDTYSVTPVKDLQASAAELGCECKITLTCFFQK